MRGNRTETKLKGTIGPVNKKMQQTKVTWQQDKRGYERAGAGRGGGNIGVLRCVSAYATFLYGLYWRGSSSPKWCKCHNRLTFKKNFL